MEQKEVSISVNTDDQLTVQVEPKVLVPKGIVLYLQGREVGYADITVDMTHVPPQLHHLVLSLAGSMRNNFYIDGIMRECKTPTPKKKSKKKWWQMLPWKEKRTT